jgi:hypothetical protein
MFGFVCMHSIATWRDGGMIILMHARKVFKAGSHSGPSGGLQGVAKCAFQAISLLFDRSAQEDQFWVIWGLRPSHCKKCCSQIFANASEACRSKGADDHRVSCATYDPNAEGITLVGSASHMTPLTKEFNAQFKNPNLTQIGSSLKFLLVRPLCHSSCFIHMLHLFVLCK